MKKIKLDNGFQIVLEKRKNAMVSIGIYVKAGLLNETPANNGISHFLEHMAFKGTTTKTAQELVEMIEEKGGNCNAYTSTAHTTYLVDLLNKDWKCGVDFLYDIVNNSIFPEEEIETERNVILQEYEQSEDRIMSVLFNNIMGVSYPKQMLGKKILGTKENISKFTRKDLLDYINENYAPNNMVLSICGNIDIKEVSEYIANKFKDLKKKELRKLPKNKFKAEDTIVKTKFNEASVTILQEGLPSNTKQKYLYRVFEHILDGGMSCRLFQKVREENGLGYATFTLDESEMDTGIFGVCANVNPVDIERAKTVLTDTLNSMTEYITDAELTKAKNLILFKEATHSESVVATRERNGINTLFKLPITSYAQKEKTLNLITKEDVLTFAKEFLSKPKYKIVLAGE